MGEQRLHHILICMLLCRFVGLKIQLLDAVVLLHPSGAAHLPRLILGQALCCNCDREVGNDMPHL